MQIESSGYYYPNKIARIYLEVLEDIMGRNGLNSVLHKAGLANLIDNYPPNNLRKAFDFAEFSALNQALDDTYGRRGGRVFALRGGKASVQAGLQAFGAAVGISGLAMKMLPLPAKVRVGLVGMAKIFSTFSDQSSRVQDYPDHWLYIIDRCPVCWGDTRIVRFVTAPSDCCTVACVGRAATGNSRSYSPPARPWDTTTVASRS